MASPLLEAGAIDGARGILINITGSSTLKLSEVNEASSLIQSAAHEDANIIFGAVLDEKMGDEVKITVIATGFRDQMPERRARMLSVEETPVVSVPVVAPDNWMREGEKEPQPKVEAELEPAKAPVPPRFMSQDEDAGTDDAFFYSSAVPPVATTVTVAASPRAATESAVENEDRANSALSRVEDCDAGFNQEPAPEPVLFEPANAAHAAAGLAVEEIDVRSSEQLFDEPQEQRQRDLDVPAFLRRLHF
jgi:cell division protein FtsZ